MATENNTAGDRNLMGRALALRAMAVAADKLLGDDDLDNGIALVAELHDRLPEFCADLSAVVPSELSVPPEKRLTWRAAKLNALIAGADSLLHHGDHDVAATLMIEAADVVTGFVTDLDSTLVGVRHAA